MEQVLIKMARQLDSFDEASLNGLWDKYAHLVNNFEPTQRWQEAVLILSFIQAKRWKNQLFNTKWTARTRLDFLDKPSLAPQPFHLEFPSEEILEDKPKAKILPFKPSRKETE